MNQIDGQKMRDLAKMIQKEIPGYGFALMTFSFEPGSLTNYVSNGQREDMIKALEELLTRWKKGTDYLTPNNN